MIFFGKSFPQWVDSIRDRIAGSKFNQDLIWIFGSMTVLAASGFIINLIIAHSRGEEALGIYNQVLVFYSITSQFTVGGIHLSVLKEVSYQQEDRQASSEITFAGLCLTAVLATVVSLAGYALSPLFGRILQSETVGNALRLAMPGLIVFSFNKVLLSCLSGLRQMRIYSVFQTMRYILILGIICGLLLTGQPGALLPVALTVTETILFMVLFPYIGNRLPLPRGIKQISDWIPKHFSFGLRGFLSSALSDVNYRVDVLILGVFASDAQVGVYSFASTLAGGFLQIPMILRVNLDPVMGAHFANHQRDQIETLARKVRRYYYPLMIAFCTLVVLLYPVVFSLLLQKSDIAYASWGIFAILMLGVLITSRFRPFAGVLLQGGNPGRYTLMLAFLTLTVVILTFVLIPILGIYGAAIGVAVMYALEAVLLFYNAKKLYGIRL